MRIISGRARGKKLVAFTGERVRPTADRVREALFSILTSRFGTLAGFKVLDLFAGTGAFALEALSRGALKAILVDAHPESARIIRTNIDGCRMSACAEVLQGEIPAALTLVARQAPFDLIFLDPPYGRGLAEATLTRIDALALTAKNGLVIAETAADERLPERIGTLEQSDRRLYGACAVSFFERTTPPA